MNRKEYDKELEDIKKRIEKLEQVEVEEDEVWKPEINENYYVVSGNGTIKKAKWIPCGLDVFMFDIGNVFKTKEEAEFEAERLNVYRKLRQFALKSGRYEGNFSIVYDYVTKEIDYWENETAFQRFGELIFKTEEDARRAVETVGVDKVLKYYLEV